MKIVDIESAEAELSPFLGSGEELLSTHPAKSGWLSLARVGVTSKRILVLPEGARTPSSFPLEELRLGEVVRGVLLALPVPSTRSVKFNSQETAHDFQRVAAVAVAMLAAGQTPLGIEDQRWRDQFQTDLSEVITRLRELDPAVDLRFEWYERPHPSEKERTPALCEVTATGDVERPFLVRATLTLGLIGSGMLMGFYADENYGGARMKGDHAADPWSAAEAVGKYLWTTECSLLSLVRRGNEPPRSLPLGLRALLEELRELTPNVTAEFGPQGHKRRGPMPKFGLVRTTRDAEENAALVLRWLGFRDAATTPLGTDSGIDVTSSAAVAQVKMEGLPTGRPAVQALFGAATAAGKAGFFFSLAGYTAQAIEWADTISLPLFRFDFQGTPEAVNEAAQRFMTGQE